MVVVVACEEVVVVVWPGVVVVVVWPGVVVVWPGVVVVEVWPGVVVVWPGVVVPPVPPLHVYMIDMVSIPQKAECIRQKKPQSDMAWVCLLRKLPGTRSHSRRPNFRTTRTANNIARRSRARNDSHELHRRTHPGNCAH